MQRLREWAEWGVRVMDEYFEYGNVRIKIMEHFADEGGVLKDILTSLIEQIDN